MDKQSGACVTRRHSVGDYRFKSRGHTSRRDNLLVVQPVTGLGGRAADDVMIIAQEVFRCNDSFITRGRFVIDKVEDK